MLLLDLAKLQDKSRSNPVAISRAISEIVRHSCNFLQQNILSLPIHVFKIKQQYKELRIILKLQVNFFIKLGELSR